MTARPALSRRERAALDCITASLSERGYPPTVREVGHAIGLTSTSSVAYVLGQLAGKGYLVRDGSSPRALRIITPADHGRGIAPVPE